MKIKTTQDEYVKSIYLYIYYYQQNSEIKKNKKKNNYMVNDVANEVAQYEHRNNKRYASAFRYIYIYIDIDIDEKRLIKLFEEICLHLNTR